MSAATKEESIKPTRKILLLHGDRQTGELLLGRISSLKRKLLKPRKYETEDDIQLDSNYSIEIVAPDGPFPWKADPSIHTDSSERSSEEKKTENDMMRTWWYRTDDEHYGLDKTLNMLHELWNSKEGFEGVLGFSRGARLTHFIASVHAASNGQIFKNLKYVIIASGYGGVNMPTHFPPERFSEFCSGVDFESIMPLQINSLHIMGAQDRLVPVESSRALLSSYVNPVVDQHDGGHHVPMRSANVKKILSFIDKSYSIKKNIATASTQTMQEMKDTIPDEEHSQLQIDECESLSMIFPEEFQILSLIKDDTHDVLPGETKYVHPITYAIRLEPSDDQLGEDDNIKNVWPKKQMSLKVQYTADYPDTLPIFSLEHEMNLLEFKISQTNACMNAVKAAAEAEIGMPNVMSCIYALRDFIENGGLLSSIANTEQRNTECEDSSINDDIENGATFEKILSDTLLKPVSIERKQHACREGLQIACTILGKKYSQSRIISKVDGKSPVTTETNNDTSGGKGGSWKYTIGLVGKPSAGKSTFFNAATAFARQRGGDSTDEDGFAIGGATMAPHPFTTIDPNIGYCLVPAPDGSCPEDSYNGPLNISSSHGRDSKGRRLIPVMLKDVAGLVPGAYQGRGRGNKFLDDLTDADVLIHVLDASGTADSEGNTVVVNNEVSNTEHSGSDPLNDIAWVQNELIEWIVSNLKMRWHSIARKGRQKLVDMFSGYKQSQAFVWDILLAVERFLCDQEGRKQGLDHLIDWDEADLYRLVTAFLGYRFPMALVLNKSDIASSRKHCENIDKNLPLHGSHCATSMCARQEMNFVKHHIYSAVAATTKCSKNVHQQEIQRETLIPPVKVWDCLQSAIQLRKPILVFPVLDMETYQPLPGMFNFATRDSSLPSVGMIACLNAAGGCAPTMWDDTNNVYFCNPGKVECQQVLRDCIIMKPNSTVEYVFEALKWLGGLSGEFIRAEAVGNVEDKPKLARKDDFIGKHNRILKIMTTRRKEWQKSMHS